MVTLMQALACHVKGRALIAFNQGSSEASLTPLRSPDMSFWMLGYWPSRPAISLA